MYAGTCPCCHTERLVTLFYLFHTNFIWTSKLSNFPLFIKILHRITERAFLVMFFPYPYKSYIVLPPVSQNRGSGKRSYPVG